MCACLSTEPLNIMVQTWTAWLQLSRRWGMPGCGGLASYCQTQLRIVWPSSESLSRNGQSRVWPGSSLQSAGHVYLCLPPFTLLLSTSIPPTAACIAGNPVVKRKETAEPTMIVFFPKWKAPMWLAIRWRRWHHTNRPLAQSEVPVAKFHCNHVYSRQTSFENLGLGALARIASSADAPITESGLWSRSCWLERHKKSGWLLSIRREVNVAAPVFFRRAVQITISPAAMLDGKWSKCTYRTVVIRQCIDSRFKVFGTSPVTLIIIYAWKLSVR